ncbi:MAG: hypothetical protein ACRBM6_01610 [Geminicoccales bacterium]
MAVGRADYERQQAQSEQDLDHRPPGGDQPEQERWEQQIEMRLDRE